MYTISGGRRLYKYENGKRKFIKRDEVFQDETITVLIKPIRLERYAKNIYIEKEFTFNQGAGSYKLIDSKPTIERIYLIMLILNVIALLGAYLLTVIDDKGIIDIPSSLILMTAGLWILCTIAVLLYRQYFKANYEQYARKLNDLRVIKAD